MLVRRWRRLALATLILAAAVEAARARVATLHPICAIRLHRAPAVFPSAKPAMKPEPNRKMVNTVTPIFAAMAWTLAWTSPIFSCVLSMRPPQLLNQRRLLRLVELRRRGDVLLGLRAALGQRLGQGALGASPAQAATRPELEQQPVGQRAHQCDGQKNPTVIGQRSACVSAVSTVLCEVAVARLLLPASGQNIVRSRQRGEPLNRCCSKR